jgi:hypothetical protein
LHTCQLFKISMGDFTRNAIFTKFWIRDI